MTPSAPCTGSSSSSSLTLIEPQRARRSVCGACACWTTDRHAPHPGDLSAGSGVILRFTFHFDPDPTAPAMNARGAAVVRELTTKWLRRRHSSRRRSVQLPSVQWRPSRVRRLERAPASAPSSGTQTAVPNLRQPHRISQSHSQLRTLGQVSFGRFPSVDLLAAARSAVRHFIRTAEEVLTLTPPTLRAGRWLRGAPSRRRLSTTAGARSRRRRAGEGWRPPQTTIHAQSALAPHPRSSRGSSGVPPRVEQVAWRASGSSSAGGASRLAGFREFLRGWSKSPGGLPGVPPRVEQVAWRASGSSSAGGASRLAGFRGSSSAGGASRLAGFRGSSSAGGASRPAGRKSRGRGQLLKFLASPADRGIRRPNKCLWCKGKSAFCEAKKILGI